MGKLTERQERVLVILISIYLFFIGLHRGGIQLVNNDVTDLFGVAAEGVGIFTSVHHIPLLFAPLLAGIVADRIGKKCVVTSFIFIFAIGCAICGFSTSFGMYLVGTFVFAMGSHVSEMLATATLSDVNVEKSAQYINLSQFMFSMGAVVGPLLVQFFSEKGGTDWRFPSSFGFLSFVVMGVVLLTVKFPPATKPAIDSEGKKTSNKKVDFSFVTPLLICLAIAMLLYIGMESGYANFIDSVMVAKLATGRISALTLSGFWLGTAIIRLVFGFANYKPGHMLRLCYGVCVILLVVLSLLPSGILSVVISFLIGAAYGPIWCIIQAVAAASSEGNSGKALGLLSIMSGIGGIVLPTVIGKLATAVKVENALYVLAVASALGFLISFKVKDK